MIIAKFMGGPHRGVELFGEPINIQVSFMDYLVFKIFGNAKFLDRLNMKHNQKYNEDYFAGVTICKH